MAKSSASERKCSTYAGYKWHKNHGESPCEACRVAYNTYLRQYKEKRKTQPKNTIQPCGTYAAYRRHINNSENPCAPCAEAHREYARNHYISKEKNTSRKGRKQGEPLKPCGTFAAYTRHHRKGEPPCEPCVEAARQYRTDNPYRATRSRDYPRKEPQLSPCGTDIAYRRHKKRHEEPCAKCVEAHYELLKDALGAKPCGTFTAYRRHLKNNEVPCDACQQAHYRAFGKPKGPRKNSMPCGTYAAYIRHMRNKEPACRLCQIAHMAWRAERRALELSATIVPLPPDYLDQLKALYGNQCGAVWSPKQCDTPIEPGKETLDHIIPLTKNGLHCMENLQIMHRGCNTGKSNKPPPEGVIRTITQAIAAAYGL